MKKVKRVKMKADEKVLEYIETSGSSASFGWTRSAAFLDVVRKQVLDLVHDMCLTSPSIAEVLDLVQRLKLDLVQKYMRPRPFMRWTWSNTYGTFSSASPNGRFEFTAILLIFAS